MMSPEVLRAINREIAAKASRERRIPYVPFDTAEPEHWPPFPFPNLGTYVPPGWELTDDAWFVDTTGQGHDHEVALTWRQFKNELICYVAEHPDHGYAIIEQGPFQAVVAAMCRVRKQIDSTLTAVDLSEPRG